MSRWYVVNTQAQDEARGKRNLRRQRFDAWLPRFRRAWKCARRIDRMLVPLFPGYLSVRRDLSAQSWCSINGTFGVVRLLCNRDAPLTVPDGLVENIMQHREASGTRVLPPRRLAAGEAVRVGLGPFADLEGLLREMSGRDRIVLLFNLLGRKVRASVLAELAA